MVIEDDIIGHTIYDFLLVFYSNFDRISLTVSALHFFYAETK